MNGGQQQTQHQQGTEAHQPPRPQPDLKTATTTTTTNDENSTGGGVGLTTGGTGAAPTVKMQQSRQEAPAVTPATVTAAAAPAMTTASAAATAVAAAAAANAANSPTASGANGSGGSSNNGAGNNSPTTAAQTVAAINKKRKKEGLKPIITTDNPAVGYVYAFLGSYFHFLLSALLHCYMMLFVSFSPRPSPLLRSTLSYPDPKSGSGLCVAAHPVLCYAVRCSAARGSELSTGRILVQDRRYVSRSASHSVSYPTRQTDRQTDTVQNWGRTGGESRGEWAQTEACKAESGKDLARKSPLRPRKKFYQDGEDP